MFQFITKIMSSILLNKPGDKLKLIFAVLCVLIAACNTTDSPKPTNSPNPISPGEINPIITILESDSTVSDNDTIRVCEPFKIAFNAQKGTADLKSWTLSIDGRDIDNFKDIPAKDKNNFNELISNISPSSNGSYKYTLSLLDIDSNSIQSDLIVTFSIDSGCFGYVKLLYSDSTVFGDTTLLQNSNFSINVSAISFTSEMKYWQVFRNGISLTYLSGRSIPNLMAYEDHIDGILTSDNLGTYEYSIEITNENDETFSTSWIVIVEQ